VVSLERRDGDLWTTLAQGTTNTDGRIVNLLPDEDTLPPGVYRLRFATEAYFRARGVAAFYPEVSVMVQLDEQGGHYHIPLLLSPFGYTTYRGS
jgi:5-hydroxyisourate hydrolase